MDLAILARRVASFENINISNPVGDVITASKRNYDCIQPMRIACKCLRAEGSECICIMQMELAAAFAVPRVDSIGALIGNSRHMN